MNCFFCYCPFYPCDGKIGNGKWIINNSTKTYDCSDCEFIHRDDVVFKIIELLYEGKNFKEIARFFIRKGMLKNEEKK